jgi:hypothetical protein
MLVAVNERPEPAKRRLSVDGRFVELPVPARGAVIAFVERPSGTILSITTR